MQPVSLPRVMVVAFLVALQLTLVASEDEVGSEGCGGVQCAMIVFLVRLIFLGRRQWS